MTKFRLARLLFAFAGFLLIWAPSPAFAHDNLGGDELAVANWMLISALVVALMGVLAIVWAARSGQFSNVEESKYKMLETAEDFDAIMAEADERRKQAGRNTPQGGAKSATGGKGNKGKVVQAQLSRQRDEISTKGAIDVLP